MDQDRLRIEWLDKADRSVLYAKFALMELARSGEAEFIQVHPSAFDENLLPQETRAALSPAQAFFVAYQGNRHCKVVLDTSESFFYLSSAIKDVDLYFCSAYSREIHEGHRFLTPYSWQKRYDLDVYRRRFERIEHDYGAYFEKLIRFIPFPVVMDMPVRRFRRTKQAAILFWLAGRFLRKRLPRKRFGALDPEYRLFKLRYDQLLGYRDHHLEYDAVIRESLWAWPWHRVQLYKALEKFPEKNIFSSLSSAQGDDPNPWWLKEIPKNEYGYVRNLLNSKQTFPKSYEEMITSSRLALFPTGKHWGWRAITFLSLIAGGPILMDRPLFEPYFPLEDFRLLYTETN
ncbi:hypothetical protein VU13_02960, partial [Desulfobulbus sp. US5]|nr:hypothetical protein [Desulfobulbus sp. US5]